MYLFSIFSSVLIFSAIRVVNTRNPIHSVLFLILVFISVACLLVLINVELFPLIYLVVYVGAVAVLFLFIIMMIRIKEDNFRYFYARWRFLEIFLWVSCGFLIFFYCVNIHTFGVESYIHFVHICEFMTGQWRKVISAYSFDQFFVTMWVNGVDSGSEFVKLGVLLFREYFVCFLLAGLILLLALVGSIILTISFEGRSRIQSISKQVARNSSVAVFLVDVKV